MIVLYIVPTGSGSKSTKQAVFKSLELHGHQQIGVLGFLSAVLQGHLTRESDTCSPSEQTTGSRRKQSVYYMNFPFLPVEPNPLTCTPCPTFTGGLGGRAGRMLYIASSILPSEFNTAMLNGESRHAARFLWELCGMQKTVR